jgi:hypothetical protein
MPSALGDAATRPYADHQFPEAGLETCHHGTYVGQGEAHARGPRRGLGHDGELSMLQAASIYLIRELRPQRLHYCDMPLGRIRGLEGTLGQCRQACQEQIPRCRGFPGADALLVSMGSFGHSFAPAGPDGIAGLNLNRERSTRNGSEMQVFDV